MTLVFLDHGCFWRRLLHNRLCVTDVLSDLIYMALCCCIIFENIFAYIVHSDRWPCCKMSILDGFDPCVCYRAETACMQVFYGFLDGLLFINILSRVFMPKIQWRSRFEGGAPQAGLFVPYVC
jgi:hypothetical protein